MLVAKLGGCCSSSCHASRGKAVHQRQCKAQSMRMTGAQCVRFAVLNAMQACSLRGPVGMINAQRFSASQQNKDEAVSQLTYLRMQMMAQMRWVVGFVMRATAGSCIRSRLQRQPQPKSPDLQKLCRGLCERLALEDFASIQEWTTSDVTHY